METIKPVLRAAGIAAFVVGTLLLFLNPPSLSGAEGLLSIVVGAIALVLLTAWATVALTGREGPSEREVDRLVERSEELARRPRLVAPASEFDALVADAIDRLPAEFQQLLERTPVIVSHRGAEVGAYGHYFGDTVAQDHHEDRIIVYQDTLERDFGHDPELLGRQIERTVRHELAHHLGWNEEGVRELGL